MGNADGLEPGIVFVVMIDGCTTTDTWPRKSTCVCVG